MLWKVKKALYRMQQRVMKTTAQLIPFPTPGLLSGPGSVKQLADAISVRGLKHMLVVTDRQGPHGTRAPQDAPRLT